MDIIKTYELPFPVDAVYTAWTSPDTVIAPANHMIIEPVPGGRCELYMDEGDDGPSSRGRFHCVQPLKRLTYTWEWDSNGEATIVDVRFESADEQTSIHLSHRGFQSEESRAMHDAGWDNYIRGLVDHMQKDGESAP